MRRYVTRWRALTYRWGAIWSPVATPGSEGSQFTARHSAHIGYATFLTRRQELLACVLTARTSISNQRMPAQQWPCHLDSNYGWIGRVEWSWVGWLIGCWSLGGISGGVPIYDSTDLYIVLLHQEIRLLVPGPNISLSRIILTLSQPVLALP